MKEMLKNSVEIICEPAGTFVTQLKQAETPCIDDHQMNPAAFKAIGVPASPRIFGCHCVAVEPHARYKISSQLAKAADTTLDNVRRRRCQTQSDEFGARRQVLNDLLRAGQTREGCRQAQGKAT